jgi:hypothetical protein
MKHFLPGRTFLFALLVSLLAPPVSTVARAEDAAPASAGGPPSAASLMAPWRQKELFSALDLSGDLLAPVRAAMAKGDYAAAEHAWADYLRHRTSVPWTFKGGGKTYDYQHPVRDASYHNQAADDAVNGKVIGGLVKVSHTWPDNNIDWFFNATKATPPFNYEWQWQLCRMAFWGDLAADYRATGDERYPKAWAQQLCSFVGECPVPYYLANNPYSAWRTIESGIRMQGVWPDAFFSFLESPSITDDDIAVYTVSCLDHGRYLRSFPTLGNFLTMEMNGLYTDGCVFPEFKEAKDWRAFAAKKLFEQEAVQFLPDGAQFELSTSYHNVALDNVSGLAHTAQKMGRLDELPPGYVSRMEKAYDYDLYFMTPDRSLPRFNDSWGAWIKGDMKIAFEFFPKRADFQWVATDGAEGQAPATTSQIFRWAGYVAMRSGWGRDANYAAFRLGSIGAGHMQQDKLDFLIWSYGTEVLYSSGGGSYEQSKWRSYATDTFSHNCVLVDGLPQRRQTKDRMANIAQSPINGHWQTTPQYDFARGLYTKGWGTEDNLLANQVRRVLFVKPDLFVVADTLTPHDNREHTYQARWNLMPVQTHQDPTSNEVTTTAPGQPNLAVVPLETEGLVIKDVSAQTKPELLGWNVRKDLVPESVPATTVTHTRKGDGPQSFLTLFIPIKPGATEPVQSVTSNSATSAVVTLVDGRKLTISASKDPTGPVELTETLANGATGRHVIAK